MMSESSAKPGHGALDHHREVVDHGDRGMKYRIWEFQGGWNGSEGLSCSPNSPHHGQGYLPPGPGCSRPLQPSLENFQGWGWKYERKE